MLRVIALLLLIPLVDAIFLVYVATTWLTAVQTVALVVLTGLIGMLLVRAEGRRTLRKLQTKLARGDPPTDELLDGGLLIAAGAFLLTPGLVTDALGILLVVPPSRIPIRIALKRYVITPYIDEQTDGLASGKVYTFGFPNPDQAGGPQSGSAAGDDDAYDLGSDAYEFEPGDREE